MNKNKKDLSGASFFTSAVWALAAMAAKHDWADPGSGVICIGTLVFLAVPLTLSMIQEMINRYEKG